MKRYLKLKESKIKLSLDRYTVRYRGDVLIMVSPKTVLDRHAKDDPDMDVYKHPIGDRVARAKKFILAFWDNPHEIFYPSVIGFKEVRGKNVLYIEDGRHRLQASYELGIPEVAVEVPKNQRNLAMRELS